LRRLDLAFLKATLNLSHPPDRVLDSAAKVQAFEAEQTSAAETHAAKWAAVRREAAAEAERHWL
jgi:hypothetical protein